ncbi:hypothetical protein AUK22_05550 [bacterium CG2_30_54_10]|nr:MAG: hypothetical protein AUK22_05550 [bacterium CG2_30_54_10]
MTPEELWKEAVHGSQPAWEKLYAMFGGRLYQFFLKNTSNPELAMDKSQEVFERLFRHKEAFHTGSLKTWMFHIAKNLLIDEWRRRPRADILAENPPDIADPGVRVEDEVIAKLDREQIIQLLDAALPKLPANDRIAVGLVYLGGLSFPELAKVMDIPIGTAKTQVRQARIKLDKMLTAKLEGQTAKEEA